MLFLKKLSILILFLLLILSGCVKNSEGGGNIIPTGQFSVNVNINTNKERITISPYIYGANQDVENVRHTARRIGGNRLTGYNWETNMSNAGSDWYHYSDYYLPWVMGIPQKDYNIPAIVLSKFHDDSLKMGAISLITLQMAGYVAKDANGTVKENETAPSPRWAQVQFKKNSPFSLTPDTTDNFVYIDELINFLINKYGKANTNTGIKGYLLDNEPDLWSSTHPRIHPNKTTCNELIQKSVELAKVIKEMDKDAEVMGYESYGFMGYYSLQDAPDWNQVKGNHKWFISYYLQKMKEESQNYGKRLLDVLSLHWYPEARGGNVRICFEGENNIDKDVSIARMQAPRTLWDPTYKSSQKGVITAGENSWINQWFPEFLPIIPTIKKDIETYYPGTKLAITEYDYGGRNHISGGIAQTDVLGIFGKYGIYLATRWGDSGSYISSAYNIYLNYDGKGSKYGDICVKAETSDVENMPVYASIHKDNENKLHIIIINRNWDKEGIAKVNIESSYTYSSCVIWGFDYNSPNIRKMGEIKNIENNRFELKVPPLTVYHLVF
ncbi:MAG: glycoside hydrolase family 44 protein [Dictyoglomus sp.]|nr:glycoside hydrolase family 44 protein [Dictyoglomus sp.]MDW8189169.1 glycoside hydrolase family 44 protein [Dictyoglomus sp.]